MKRCNANCQGQYCPVRSTCLFSAPRPTGTVDSKTIARSVVHAGDVLIEQGDERKDIYIVTQGVFKVSTVSPEGDEDIIYFAYPGSILGTDSLGEDHYTSRSVCLTDGALCSMDRPLHAHYMAGSTEYSRRQYDITADYLRFSAKVMRILKRPAIERVAWFISDAVHHLQLCPNNHSAEFEFPITRQDVGNFLHLTMESVSRCFAQLDKSGLIKVNRKRLTILDKQSLHHLIGYIPQ